jgi:hypothetical protein
MLVEASLFAAQVEQVALSGSCPPRQNLSMSTKEAMAVQTHRMAQQGQAFSGADRTGIEPRRMGRAQRIAANGNRDQRVKS